jgi:hypothetical protein
VTIYRCAELADITALQGLPVHHLRLSSCPRIVDLTPLRGSRLVELHLDGCSGVVDLTPIQSLPLRALSVTGCSIKSVAPLRKLTTLQSLAMDRCLELHDLTPLAGLRLEEIRLPPQVTVGMEVIRNMPGLQVVDGISAPRYWQHFGSENRKGSNASP